MYYVVSNYNDYRKGITFGIDKIFTDEQEALKYFTANALCKKDCLNCQTNLRENCEVCSIHSTCSCDFSQNTDICGCYQNSNDNYVSPVGKILKNAYASESYSSESYNSGNVLVLFKVGTLTSASRTA